MYAHSLQGRGSYLECIGIVACPHRRDLVRVLERLVDDLDHAHVAEGVVRVDVLRHPLEKLERPFVLVVHIEAGGRGILNEQVSHHDTVHKKGTFRYLARERVLGHLSTRRTVQVDDDVESHISGPVADLREVRKGALGEVLAVPVDDVLPQPVPHGDADRVQTVALHLKDVIPGDPPTPVALEGRVGRILAQMHHAVELGLLPAAAHAAPLGLADPRLEDEEGAQIDAADLAGRGEPSLLGAVAGGRGNGLVEEVLPVGGEDVPVFAGEPG